jgi:hypothetical protein
VVIVRHGHILCISRHVDDLWQVEGTHHCNCNLTKLSDRPAPTFLALMSVGLSVYLPIHPSVYRLYHLSQFSHLSISYLSIGLRLLLQHRLYVEWHHSSWNTDTLPRVSVM